MAAGVCLRVRLAASLLSAMLSLVKECFSILSAPYIAHLAYQTRPKSGGNLLWPGMPVYLAVLLTKS